LSWLSLVRITGAVGFNIRQAGELGGADIVLATAGSGSSMTALIPGLADPGLLMVVGASSEPIEITRQSLIFDGVAIVGSVTGSSAENEDKRTSGQADNLRFAVPHGVSAMIERAPLDGASAAYARMVSGAARFRMVLNINRPSRSRTPTAADSPKGRQPASRGNSTSTFD
jgi:alcohol dehydrogenase, propanol-preferring